MTNRVIPHNLASGLALPKPRERKRGLKRWFLGTAVVFGFLLAGCSQGTYPVDIFYEQHYQQSYRSYEPPRLSGVADAVAFYPPTASMVTNTGAELFLVNCQMCHGVDAKGTGPVLTLLIDRYGYVPIVGPNITDRPPVFIASRLAATSRPFGPDSVMPPFGKLLSAAERTAIAQYIGSLPK